MSIVRSACTALLAAAAAGAGAQSIEKGALLVAAPDMTESSFAESVVLLIHHDDNGTLGLVINRPTRLEPARLFPNLEYLEDFDGPVYYGGPVAPTRVLLLLRDPPAGLTDGTPVLGELFVTGDAEALIDRDPDEWRGRTRVYAGHAAWEPGRLDQEIAAGRWTVRRGSADRVFADDPLELWQRLRSGADGSELVVGRPSGGAAEWAQPPTAGTGEAGSASRSALR